MSICRGFWGDWPGQTLGTSAVIGSGLMKAWTGVRPQGCEGGDGGRGGLALQDRAAGQAVWDCLQGLHFRRQLGFPQRFPDVSWYQVHSCVA